MAELHVKRVGLTPYSAQAPTRPQNAAERAAAAAALPLAALLLLSGCTTATSADGGTSASTSPTSSGSTLAPRDAPAGSLPEDDATVAPVPEAASTSQAAAIAAAEKVVAAFGRPDLPYPQWMDGLYPLMTQAGAAAYEDTDPQNVPVHQVTGSGTILPGSTEVALIVQIPTDAGPYNVSLSRTTPDGTWLADRIRPAGA
jgi:hypothetical protein